MIFASFHLLLNDDALVQHKHRYCMHKINVAGKMEKLLTRRCRSCIKFIYYEKATKF